MPKKTRTRYTDEFRREAVRLCEEGAAVVAVAADLGIDASNLRRWIQRDREDKAEVSPSRPLPTGSLSEIQRLQAELRRVTMERDILKKALGYFAKDPQ